MTGTSRTFEVELGTAEMIALRRFAASIGIDDLSIALHFAVVEYLTGAGFLDLPGELDEDTETLGSA
jgi:hypothetical protein